MRCRRLIPLFAAAGMTVAAATLAEETAPRSVRDLGYGELLFHYFLDQPLAALTTAAVADTRGGFKGHGQHPKLLEGGIRLQFGLDESAERIFRELLDSNATPAVRGQAWFYLAKIAYQRQQFQRAQDLLARVDTNHLPVVHDDYLLLKSNIAVRLDQHADAVEISAAFDEMSPLLPYAQYNAGVAWQKRVTSGKTPAILGGNLWQYAAAQFDAAIDSSKRLAREEGRDSEEYLALADRANLAAGYVLLAAKQYEGAITHFRQVRLSGPYASDAMLGYGWAATQAGHYQVALTPWEHLSRQPLINAAVQESYLALPYIYEKLEAPGEALRQYERSAAIYQAEILRLNDAIEAIGKADIASTFVETSGEGPINWVVDDQDLTLKPHSPYLTQLLSNHGFHALLMDWRDLRRLREELASWQQKLAVYSDIASSAETRQQASQQLDNADFSAMLQRLSASRDKLVAQLKKARRQRDWYAVLPAEEFAANEQIKHSERQLQSLQRSGVDMSDAAKRLDFLRGLMAWQAAEQFKLNVRQQQRTLQHIEQQISALQQRLEGANNARGLSGSAQAQQLLARGQQRLQDTLVSLDEGSEMLERAMREQAAAAMTTQRDNIISYLAQVRVSITRLYDLSAQRNGELD